MVGLVVAGLIFVCGVIFGAAVALMTAAGMGLLAAEPPVRGPAAGKAGRY
jgi:hypothetical protein